MRTKIQCLTHKCVFHYRPSNFRRLRPASDYCRVRRNQIVEHSSGNEMVLGSSRKLRGAAEHLIDGSEKRICRLSFEFWSPHVTERRSNCFFDSLYH